MLKVLRMVNNDFWTQAFIHSEGPCFIRRVVAQWVKNLPAVQETQEMQVWFLGQEDPLEKEMATQSNILAWEIPCLVGYSSRGRKESDVTQWRSTHTWWSVFYQESSNKNIFFVRRCWVVSAQQLKGYSSVYYLQPSRRHYRSYCAQRLNYYYLVLHVLVAQSCLTLWDPMDSSLPSSSVHGALQARIHEQVAILFSRRSSQPRDWTQVSCIGN